MTTPACPLLVAARLREYRPTPTSGDVACLGSRCAWWVKDGSEPRVGSCGLGNGQQYADPSWPDPSRPTTRQTTRKPA